MVGGRKWSGGDAERIAKRGQSATATPGHRRKRARMRCTKIVSLVTIASLAERNKLGRVGCQGETGSAGSAPTLALVTAEAEYGGVPPNRMRGHM